MLVTSIETVPETRRFPPVISRRRALPELLGRVLDVGAVRPLVLNTLLVTTACVIGNLVFCSLAGYAFARLRVRRARRRVLPLLATLMVPFQVIMIPTFLIIRSAGLIDTLAALIVPNLATRFGIFLMRQFFRTLPVELEEAARIDGRHGSACCCGSCCRCPGRRSRRSR